MHKRPPFADRLAKRVAKGHVTEDEATLALFVAGQCGVELLLRNMGTHWVASFEWCAVHSATGACPNGAMRSFGRRLKSEGYINAATYNRFAAVAIPAKLYA